jgi:hypothetical protein
LNAAAPVDAVPDGPVLTVANEFSEVRVSCVRTRNGIRLLIESPKSQSSIALCPLELEALTWQTAETFSGMLSHPFTSSLPESRE